MDSKNNRRNLMKEIVTKSLPLGEETNPHPHPQHEQDIILVMNKIIERKVGPKFGEFRVKDSSAL